MDRTQCLRVSAWNATLDRMCAHDHARRERQPGEVEEEADGGAVYAALYDALVAYHVGAIAPIACPCPDCA